MFKFLEQVFGSGTYDEQFARMERWQQLEERSRWATREELDYMTRTGMMPSGWFEADGFTCKTFSGPGETVLKTYKGSWMHKMDRQNIEDAKPNDWVRGGPRRTSPYL